MQEDFVDIRTIKIKTDCFITSLQRRSRPHEVLLVVAVGLHPRICSNLNQNQDHSKRDFPVENETPGHELAWTWYTYIFQFPLKRAHPFHELWLNERVEKVSFFHKSGLVIAGPNQNPLQEFTQNGDIFASRVTLVDYCTFKTHCWGSLYQGAYLHTTYEYGVSRVDLQFHIPIRDGRGCVKNESV